MKLIIGSIRRITPRLVEEVTFILDGSDPDNQALLGEHLDGRVSFKGSITGPLAEQIQPGARFEMTLTPIAAPVEAAATNAAAPESTKVTKTTKATSPKPDAP